MSRIIAPHDEFSMKVPTQDGKPRGLGLYYGAEIPGTSLLDDAPNLPVLARRKP